MSIVSRCSNLCEATHWLWLLASNPERRSTPYCSAGVRMQDESKNKSPASRTSELNWSVKQQTPLERQLLKRSKQNSRSCERSKRVHTKGSARSIRSSHKQTKTSQTRRRRLAAQCLVRVSSYFPDVSNLCCTLLG
jgi:hypothetical protein